MPGPGHGMGGVGRPKNMKKTFMRLAGYLLRDKLRLLLIVFFTILSSLSGVVGTYFLKPIINEGILPLVGTNPSFEDFLPLIKLITIAACVFGVGALSSYVYSRMMVTLSTKTLNSLRKEIFERMEDLPISYFDTHTHGELMSRFTSDVDALREAISNSAVGIINSAITVAGTFIMMLIISPLLTLLIILMLALMLFIVKTIGGKSAANFKAQQKAIGAANGYIEEMIEGLKEVKVFSREERIKADYAVLNENLRVAATKANTYASILMPIMGNLSYVNYALTASVGALMVISGRIDIGSIASYLQYSRQFSQPIVQVSQQFNSILMALAGAERIFEILDEKPEIDSGYVTLVNCTEDANGNIIETDKRTGMWAWKHPHSSDNTVTYTPLRGDVQFENVTFGYVPNKTVLNNVTLYAKPGQKIALVGSTGAGKTTITNLINRFYELTDGKIRYDGINITKIKKDDLRRSLGMVLQDTHLFTGTVKENIRYGRLDATDEEIVAAAKLANAHWFIKHLPDGYDTMLTGDGTNLSQGQRQLIAIARAAVADPPVLILDEATSSIDTRTEALIEKGMDTLMKGRTVFVIAHRLSTVRNADCILVLENGEIIERGNHDELLELKGRYYQLYTGQFELS